MGACSARRAGRALRAAKADAKARALARLARKPFELGAPLGDKGPAGKAADPRSEALFKSRAEKAEKARGWSGSPPRLAQVEKKSGALALRALAARVGCPGRGAGRASKSCKKAPRKKRCLASPPASKRAARGKKPAPRGAAGAPAGARARASEWQRARRGARSCASLLARERLLCSARHFRVAGERRWRERGGAPAPAPAAGERAAGA